MRISDWSSDVCSSDLPLQEVRPCAVCNAGTGNLRHRLRESAEHCCADPLVCCRLASSPATRRPRRLFCRGHARTPRQPLSPPAQLAAVRSAGRQVLRRAGAREHRSEEHTSELQSLMRISYAVFCLKKKKTSSNQLTHNVCS